MTRLKSIAKVALLIILLVVPGFLVIQTSLPKLVSAAACTNNFQGGGGGGSLLSLSTQLGSVDSSVEKITTEFTPAQTWQDGSSTVQTAFQFAKNDCTSAGASVRLSLVGKSLSIDYYEPGRTGSFVSGTDYKNLVSGATVSTATDASLYVNYAVGTVGTSTAQQLSVDLGTDAGFANIYLKQGSGSETLLMSIQLPTNTTSFLVTNGHTSGVSYAESSFSGETCTGITGAGEIAVRMLLDGTASALTATPWTSAVCGNFDETSYDSGTKTATLRYDTMDEDPNHVVSGLNSFKTASDEGVRVSTSLNAEESGGSYYMSDQFVSSNEATQPLYFYVQNYTEGKSTPVGNPYPVVGGTIDFSAGDLNLTSSGITMDVSAAKYATFAHNFGSVTATGSFTLFAPQKEGDTFVGVCPGASTIDAVNTTCTNLYFLKEGQTKNGVTASLVTVGATKFWQVSGLTGTGIFSSTIDAIPGSPKTGDMQRSARLEYIVFGSVVVVVFASITKWLRLSRKRR